MATIKTTALAAVVPVLPAERDSSQSDKRNMRADCRGLVWMKQYRPLGKVSLIKCVLFAENSTKAEHFWVRPPTLAEFLVI